MDNNYTIYMNQLLEGKLTKWGKYFENISYDSGLRFLQSQRNVVNVKYAMQKTADVNDTEQEYYLKYVKEC